MPAPYSKPVLVHAFLLALFLFHVVNAENAAQQHVARKRPVKQEQPAPPPPDVPPPPPPTLQQMPAVPPQVSFSNGLLTIVAENSTLSDILRAVRTQTGAAGEIPSHATHRAVTPLGPGAPPHVPRSPRHGFTMYYLPLL